MVLASLLTLPTNERGAVGFVFDHDQLHRAMLEVASANGQPPLLDPAPISATSERAGSWHYGHQTAHDQFDQAVFGFQTPQNMADSTFAENSSLTWWTFVNHQEHLRDSQVL